MESDMYKKGKKIGKGAFGKVYLVTSNKNGETYVLKEVEINANTKVEEVKNESELLKILNSKYITKYIDSFENNEGGFSIVMEYCDGGDLSELIRDYQKKDQHIPEEFILKTFIEMCLGVGYLHKNNLIHRDLKPGNVFLTKKGETKIGDLGLAKKMANINDPTKTFCGTLVYMSPELLLQAPYNFKSDIWALGIILYELMTLRHPFEDVNPMLLYQKLISGYFEPIKQNYSKQLKDLPSKILLPNDKNRPDIKTILKDNFLIAKAKQFNLLPEVTKYIGEQIDKSVSFHNDELEFMQNFLVNKLHIDPKYFDFTKNNRDGGWASDVEKRGGEDYYPPHGWYGIGLNTDVLYPEVEDNDWLGDGRVINEEKMGEWAVAYHGLRKNKGGKLTISQKIVGIIQNGLKEGPNQEQQNNNDLRNPGKKVGKGVYHYYNIQDLIINCNVSPSEDGFLFIFMCRVNPEKIRQPHKKPFMWVLHGDTSETRPYRLLFRRVHSVGK